MNIKEFLETAKKEIAKNGYVLVTQDGYDDTLYKEGCIQKIETIEEAQSYLESWNDEDHIIVDDADYGDCWYESHATIDQLEEYKEKDAYVFDGIPCNMQKPGSHPGGNCYWFNPQAIVYLIQEKDEEGE